MYVYICVYMYIYVYIYIYIYIHTYMLLKRKIENIHKGFNCIKSSYIIFSAKMPRYITYKKNQQIFI